MNTDWKRRPIVCGGLLVLLTLVAYLPVLQHGGFIWDDDFHVTNNPWLRSGSGLVRIWTQPTATPQYYPLVHTTFWIEYHLWQLNPFGYHLVNVLLHALNAVLLWRLLTKLDLPRSWVAAAIFALHPVCVESVAWISERKNVLSALFYLSAALAYVEFWMWGSDKRRWVPYAAAFALFVGALLSKTVTCTLPATLLIVLWWKRGRIRWGDVLPLVPFFVVGAAMGLTTAWIERHRVGAMGGEWDLSFADRWLVAGRVVAFYAAKLLYPHPLSFVYERWQIAAGAWQQWLFPLGVIALLAALWALRKRIGRGPLAAAAAFVAILGPALGFVNVYPFRFSFVADHFQYLASVAVITLVAARLPSWGATTVVCLLAVLTWQQSRVYENMETLWIDVIAKNPTCWMAHNNLGVELAGQGRTNEAVACYREALRLKPDFADPSVNLGNLAAMRHDDVTAIAVYGKALRAAPGHFNARFNLALALGRLGRMGDSIHQYRLLLTLNPEMADAHYNLGTALGKLGHYEEAIAEFQTALRLRPDFANARHNLELARRRLAGGTSSG